MMTIPSALDLAGETAKHGVFALLCKPLRAEDLLETVARACACKTMGT